MGLDRVTTVELDLTNLGGSVPISGGGGVDSTAIVFDTVSADYQNTTPKQSSWEDFSAKEGITLEFEINKTGTPTGVLTIEVLTADTTSSPTTNGSVHIDFMGDYSFVAASVATAPSTTEETVIIRGLKAPAVAIRVSATATVNGSNYYTLAGVKAY